MDLIYVRCLPAPVALRFRATAGGKSDTEHKWTTWLSRLDARKNSIRAHGHVLALQDAPRSRSAPREMLCLSFHLAQCSRDLRSVYTLRCRASGRPPSSAGAFSFSSNLAVSATCVLPVWCLQRVFCRCLLVCLLGTIPPPQAARVFVATGNLSTQGKPRLRQSKSLLSFSMSTREFGVSLHFVKSAYCAHPMECLPTACLS